MSTVEHSVQSLENLCHCAIALSSSTQDRPTSNWQLIEGSIIFGKNCLTCISLLRLIPISSFTFQRTICVDGIFPSVASLVRNIVETYHVFFYVIEDTPDSEREAREALWHFHETAERLEMLQLAVPSSAGIATLTQEFSKRKARLEAVCVFSRSALEATLEISRSARQQIVDEGHRSPSGQGSVGDI